MQLGWERAAGLRGGGGQGTWGRTEKGFIGEATLKAALYWGSVQLQHRLSF